MPNLMNLLAGSSLARPIIGLMLLIGGIAVTASAAPPSNLDPDFGTLGKVVNSPDGTGLTSGNQMALQSDGKIVMVGNKIASGQYAGFMVARYNADGSLDTDFGTDGSTIVQFEVFWQYASSIALQPDGKIVIAGTTRVDIGNIPTYQFAVVRFNTDGSLDMTFDSDGKVAVNFDDLLGGFFHERAETVKVGSDGKIIVGGEASNAAVENRFVFTRLNPDGSLDASFGTNGKIGDVTGGRSNYDSIYDMVILPDGKFVAVGFISGFSSIARVAIKYGLTGAREWTYSRGDNNPGGFGHALSAIAALPDGKFIVVGRRAGKVVVTRLRSDGTEDPVWADVVELPNGTAVSVAVQTNGKIVCSISAGQSTFRLMRMQATGLLDNEFGTGGFVNTSLSGGADYARTVLIQPDGKILAGGSSTVGSPTQWHFAIARYIGDAAVPAATLFDYDADGRADVSVFRPSENKWYILRSSDSTVLQPIFAIAGDIPVPADYDGDEKTDIAIYRPSNGAWWYLSSINGAQINVNWGGEAGDVPRPSDFDNDGKTDFIFFRPTNSTWYRITSTGLVSFVQFGLSGDKPVRGDFDGDGKSDVAIYRPSTGDWWYQSSTTSAQLAVRWGIATDIPVPADFDGDAKTDFAVYRPSTGVWYIINSGNGSFTIGSFGTSEDKPVAADYDGDGKADIAVFRPSTGIWYLLRSTAGFGATQWGISTDIPTENAFIP